MKFLKIFNVHAYIYIKRGQFNLITTKILAISSNRGQGKKCIYACTHVYKNNPLSIKKDKNAKIKKPFCCIRNNLYKMVLNILNSKCKKIFPTP